MALLQGRRTLQVAESDRNQPPRNPALDAGAPYTHVPPPVAGATRPRDATRDGAVAQLGERLVRNEEVRGSIPLSSTTVPLQP